jgi:hypothetical protein
LIGVIGRGARFARISEEKLRLCVAGRALARGGDSSLLLAAAAGAAGAAGAAAAAAAAAGVAGSADTGAAAGAGAAAAGVAGVTDTGVGEEEGRCSLADATSAFAAFRKRFLSDFLVAAVAAVLFEARAAASLSRNFKSFRRELEDRLIGVIGRGAPPRCALIASSSVTNTCEGDNFLFVFFDL